jgi:hypothetical protein
LEHAPEIGPEYSEGSENGSEEEQQDRVQEEKRQYSSAAKLWGLAKHDYDRLADRLVSFEPTAETAPDVWPLSIFMFMVTVVVHRAVRRMAPALQEFPSVQEFSEGFLRLMLNERLQDEDRHRAKDSRYRSDERFPPLADDLNGTFHVDVHHDQAIVMLVLVVIMKIRLAPNNEFPGLWRRYLAQICRHGLQWDTDTEDKCCLLWRQYFRDADSAVTDIQYLDCLRSLWAFKETAR